MLLKLLEKGVLILAYPFVVGKRLFLYYTWYLVYVANVLLFFESVVLCASVGFVYSLLSMIFLRHYFNKSGFVPGVKPLEQ